MKVPNSSLVLTALFGCMIVLTVSCGNASIPPDAATPRTVVATPTPTELELSGVYNVTGSNENGARPYEGLLTITNQDDVYKFTWHTTIAKPGGVGVQMGDALAVTYADSAYGKGCGVALYKIAPDGSLDGKIAKWGDFTFGTEKAVRTEGTTFDGKYTFTGITNAGKSYEGTLEVRKNGMGHEFLWHTGTDIVGFGIWRGNHAAISFGGPQCSFALYKVMAARSLEGHWGSQRTVAFGTENAKRQ